jgi:hypothetical protein
MFTISTTVISTTMLLAATAFDRFRKTKSTSTVDTLSTIRRTKRLCYGIISFSFIYSAVYMFTITLDSSSLKCVTIIEYKTAARTCSSVLALVFISMFGVVIVCYSKIVIFLRRHHREIFRPNQNTVNMNTAPKRKFWNRRRRIQPECHEMNRTDTHFDSSSNTKNSSSKSNKQNGSVKTTALFVQTRTNFRNENQNVVTVSQKIQSDDQKSKQLHTENNSQRQVSSQDETKQTKTTRKAERKSIDVERHRKKINATTLMMFLITVIYVTTWIITWSSKIYKTASNIRSLKTEFLVERLYLINCMTNPIFYIFMSSKFKQKAKELFCK